MNLLKKILCSVIAVILSVALISGCGNSNGIKLDPKNPVTITIWHYYTGALLNAFETATKNFNETIGMERGIIIESYSFSYISELEQAIMASANKQVGSMDMPNIFSTYADTAYIIEQLGLLADLSDHFPPQEQAEYFQSFIEEGRIGLNGELRIFPVAKSTEVMMLNETDWIPFASANGISYDDLITMEGLARVAEIYYEWSGGNAFFGRDVRANLFIIASKQFGVEIFEAESGSVKLNVDDVVMRKIWDYYYVPYISGYYTNYGRFSSDDAKVGDVLAYVGSTASSSYFPTEVTKNRQTYNITAKVLPAPLFEGGSNVMVQQGAGMVVSKSTPAEEYASMVFLKWFTDIDVNISFAAISGYLPVKNESLEYDMIRSRAAEEGISFDSIKDETLRVAIEGVKSNELYTNRAFTGGVEARAVLETHLQEKAVADRAEVLLLIAGGRTHEEAVAHFNTDEKFNSWLKDLTDKLAAALG